MFIKKEFSDEELKQKLELDKSIAKASEVNKEFKHKNILKLKDHSNNTSEIRMKVENETRDFSGLKPSLDSNSIFLANIYDTKTIENFQTFMQQSETVVKASKMVELLEKYTKQDNCESIKSRPKVFMSLALLAMYPDEIMPNATNDELRLIDSANIFFSNLLEFLNPEIEYSFEKHQDITSIWISTVQVFDEWFAKDKSSLLQKMNKEFICWTKTIGNMQLDESSHAEWEPHALKYQNEILKRIYEVFGKEEIENLSKNVLDLNKTFKNAELFINFDMNLKIYMCKWIFKNPHNGIESDNGSEILRLESETLEKVKATNIRILHELMLKENTIDFENILKLQGKSMLEVSEANKDAILRLISILGQESSPENIISALNDIFRFICASLLDLAGDNEDYRQEIALIDCSIYSSTWVSDACTLLTCILGMCRKCCAPARDKTCFDLEACILEIDHAENISILSESFATTFTILFDLLNGMRSDFCNFRLRYLAAQIDGKGIAENYELEEFKKTFASGYPKTEKWLLSEKGKESKPLEILVDSYLRILDPEIEENMESNVPETFYMDYDRISKYRKQLATSLIREAAMIYFKNYIRSSKNCSKMLENISKNIEVQLQNVSDIEDIRKIFLKFVQNVGGTDESEILIKGNLARLFTKSGSDKVLKLLKNRKFSKLRLALISEQKSSTEELIGSICSLFLYNKICFSEIYDAIILKK